MTAIGIGGGPKDKILLSSPGTMIISSNFRLHILSQTLGHDRVLHLHSIHLLLKQ